MTNQIRTSLLGLVTTLAMLGAPNLQAQEEMRGRLLLGLDMTFGGDTLLAVLFSDGSTDDIAAGDSMLFSAGYGMPITPTTELQLQGGFSRTSINGSNGSAEWGYTSLEAALALHPNDRFEISAGLVSHLNPSLKGDGVLGGSSVDFENAVGTVLRMSWALSPATQLGFKWLNIDYDVSGFSGITADGSGFGVTFQGRF